MMAAYLVAAMLWGEAVGFPGVAGLNGFDSYGALLSTAWRFWPFPLSVVFVSFWLLSFCAIESRRDPRCLLAAAVAPLVAVPVFHALLCAVMLLLNQWADLPGDGAWKAFVWGPPLVAIAFVLAIVTLIGMMGRQSTDDVREWWSRLAAWLGIYATGWMILAVSAVYGPTWIRTTIASNPWTALSAGGGWIGTIVAGLFAGNSSATGVRSEKSTLTRVKEIVAAVAPFVFIAGLLLGVSYALDSFVAANIYDPIDSTWAVVGATPHAVHAGMLFYSMAALLGCLAAVVLLAARVDINEFSLNAFYRNRLVRCYLGATRFSPAERNPQNFTGFDGDDDVHLRDIVPPIETSGPLHIVNCALNLGGSSDLALHTRHSAAFTLTPLFCGSAYRSHTLSSETWELGFVPTAVYGGGRSGSPTLGQAISVSGAAASPNMGFHTSPVVAFLLTVFNMRLGWWFPNPARTASTAASPRFNLRYLLAELFGGATDESDFLMISDGGHFENLGAYELVRRRCRVIIISDAECDPKLAFEGLGRLIRMCEVDFSVRINIDVAAIRPDVTTARSARPAAIGRIDYGDGSPDGILIYLKASMTGREDTAVQQYKATHPTFPHESTGDQFYGEDQFESYRRLGEQVAEDVFATADSGSDLATLAATLVARETGQLTFSPPPATISFSGTPGRASSSFGL